MSAPEPRELLGKALVEIRALKARLKEIEGARHEPIAIVGYGCRFPRAENPAAFWRLLRDGVDAVREVPRDRFDIDAWYDADPDQPGRIYTRCAAFLDRVDGFDSGFFSISPREVANLSPQQRLLLEVAWEAFEDANLLPAELFGSSMGVFIGQCGFDEGPWNATGPRQPEEIDLYSLTGSTLSITAGRLSYFFGVTGPSFVVDTACSSSLVALQLACQSLRQGDCERALVGGVHVLTSPSIMLGLCRIKALAPDGRCKTFDARADGYGRGEGCGVVLLRRLSDAIAAGDRIHAVIRGVAINQDGASGGLTVPSGPSQSAAIRRALADGGVDPADVAYVEAHGTGTSLGDPIEMGALRAVHGARSRERPLYVGSVKSNVGHLEAAAGIAGLLKVVLALENRAIPPSLHFKTPNPHIPWESLPFEVPTRCLPWPQGAARKAGVSSFGLGGTNVHVVVEAAPDAPAASASDASATPASLLQSAPVLLLSGRDEPALREAAAQMERFLAAAPGLPLGDLCHVAATGRTHFAERAALEAGDRAALAGRLKELALGRVGAGVERGRADEAQPPEIGFVFPDMGPDMGPATGAIDALARRAATLRSFGVAPDFVAGEGIGAIAAAADAGIFPVEDALAWAAAFERCGTPEADAALARRIGSTKLAPPRCRFLSPISGAVAGEEATTAAFWLRVLRGPREAGAKPDGARVPVTTTPESPATSDGRRARRLLLSMEPGDGPHGRKSLLDALVRAHLAGARVNWGAVEGGARRGAASLPTYPFQRESYPIHVAPGPTAAQAAGAATPFSSWLYETRWIARRDADAKPAEPGRWLLLADRAGFCDELSKALAARGSTCVVARSGGDETSRLLASSGGAPLRGVVHLAGLDAASGDLGRATLAGAARAACESALLLAQALARLPARGRPKLTIVTRGAQPVTGNALEPLQATLWGLGRSFALESPEIWGGLVDLDPAQDAAASAAALARELCAAPAAAEERVALRGSERHVERLARCEAAAAAPLKLRPDASYLVTGGLGGIGLELAQRLAARGAKHLVLLGRRAPSEAARTVLQKLEKLGCEARVGAVDVGNDVELGRLLDEIDRSGAPLRGIFHCAGVVEDVALARQEWSHFEKVLESKLHGSANLHRLTERRELDHFVLFSSLASILGSVGQANYGAANGYLDALAVERRARNLPALSIQWGAWSEVGLARDDAILRGLEDRGFGAMANAPAFDALEWAMAQRRPRLAIAPVDWPRFLAQLPPDSPRSLFADMTREIATTEAAAAVASDAAEAGALRAELERGSNAERLRLLKKLVAEEVAAVLRFAPGRAVDDELGFFQMGMNSLTTVELRRRIGGRLALGVSATMVFDHPTVRALAARLARELFGEVADEKPAEPPASAPPRAAAESGELADVSSAQVGRLLDRELESLGDLLSDPDSAPERSK